MSRISTPISNPYVGPRTFTEQEGRFFFGREREARDLTARIVSERLLLFYAQSGAGKSSLINARVVPKLRDEERFQVLPVGRVSGELPSGVDGVDNIYAYNLMTSLDQGSEPSERLAHVTLSEFLARLARETVSGTDGGHSRIWVYKPQIAIERPIEGLQKSTAGPRFALVIDQFEEIITGHPGRWQEREAFFRQLNQALLDDPSLWVVLTLREDFVAALDPYAELTFNRLRARFYMERMGVDAALDAVREPAGLGGRPFAPGVAERLVDDLRLVRAPGQDNRAVAGQYVEPVQLQVVCYQLWERLHRLALPFLSGEGGDGGRAGEEVTPFITEADLSAAGDVNQALEQFYSETLTAVLAQTQIQQLAVTERALRAWFDRELITETGIRNTVYRNEASGRAGTMPNTAVDALSSRFLLRTELRGGGAWIELVHDRFVEPIQVSNRVWFSRNLNPLTQAAQTWLANGKHESRLYSGSQLAAAADQLRASPVEFGDVERAFIEAGQKAEAYRSTQRQRAIAWGAALLSLVFIALTVWALWSRGQAQGAQERAVAEATRALDAEATARAERGVAQAEATRALDAEATARAERGVAQKNANVAATRAAEANVAEATAVAAEEQAVAAKAEVERLTRGIRADQLTANALKVLDESPPLSLLLAVEGLRQQDDVNESVVNSAQNNVHDLLGQVGGFPLAGRGSEVRKMAFSPDGRWISVTGGADTLLWRTDNPAAEPIRFADSSGYDTIFSPDSRWLATPAEDIIRLWDIGDPTGEPIVLTDYGGSGLVFSPNGDSLAARSDVTDSINLWDLTRPITAPRTLSGLDSGELTFSPDGRWLSTDGRRLLDVSDPGAVPIILDDGEDRFKPFAFSPDSRWLVTVTEDNVANLWPLAAGSFSSGLDPIVLEGHEGEIRSVAFSPDSHWLATGSLEDNTIRLWNMVDLSSDPIIIPDLREVDLVFSSDSRWLTSLSGLYISEFYSSAWDLNNVTARPILHSYLEGRSLARSPDNRWIATNTEGKGSLRLWDVTDPKSAPIDLQGHETEVNAATFSPTGQQLVTAADDGIRLWNLSSPAADPIVLGHGGDTLAFSRDGSHLAVTSYGTSYLWDLSDPAAEPISRTIPITWQTASFFHPDGRWLVSDPGANGPALLRDVTDLSADPIPLPDNFAYLETISSDGRWLAYGSGSNGSTFLWDTSDPGASPISLGEVGGQIISPDGRWLVSAVRFAVVLHDLANPGSTAIEVPLDPNHGSPYAAMSPDGRWLVAGMTLGSAIVVDMSDPGADPRTMPSFGFDDVSFSPSPVWLALQSFDTVSLLEVTHIDADPVVLHPGENLEDVVFGPDGRWLATASSDTSSLWTWRVPDLIDVACRVAGRNLTQAEWALYFPNQDYRRTCHEWIADPEVISSLLRTANDLAESGKISEAVAFVRKAQELDPTLDGDARSLNVVCWSGALYRRAASVLDVCNTAVGLANEPDLAGIRDSRALARALSGNVSGAIEDFEYFAEHWQGSGDNKETVEVRKAWIERLLSGEDPASIFDDATLEALRND